MPARKVNQCKVCKGPVVGRAYANAQYCKGCFEDHRKKYKSGYFRDRYRKNKFVTVGVLAALSEKLDD